MGLGHVAMLMPIAHALYRSGHEPILALRDLKTTRPLWENSGFKVVQAPAWQVETPQNHGVEIRTLADVLFLAGYADITTLLRFAGEWQALAQRERVDAVIAEYSPTAAIAYRGLLPFVTVGTPFSTPPAGMPMLNIRAWEKEIAEKSRQRENMALEAVRAVRLRLGLAPFDFLADLFGGEKVFVLGYPELDGYAAYRQQPAIGPVSVKAGKGFTPFLPPDKPRAFLYLSGKSADLRLSLESLNRAAVPCDTFIRNIGTENFGAYCNIAFHDSPQDLQKTLKERSVIVHHGGHATSCEALAMGIPQLILASQLEQQVTASMLMSIKCAVGFARKQRENDPTLVTKALQHITQDKLLWDNAQKKAQEIALRYARDSSVLVAEAID